MLTSVTETHHLTCTISVDISLTSNSQNLLFFACGFFLDTTTCQTRPTGNSWPSGAILNQHTSFMDDIYLRNIWTVTSGIRTLPVVPLCFVMQPLLSAFNDSTSLLTLFSVLFTAQTALKPSTQRLFLGESTLEQNQIISQSSRGTLVKLNQPCVYNLGQNQVRRSASDEVAVINGERNCSYTHLFVLSFLTFSACLVYLIRAPLGTKA